MSLPVEDGKLGGFPKPKPSFEWFFVSEVIESGTTSDQLLRLWEQGRINMWVTLPAGVYRLPDNSQIFHIESFGPLQISNEALPDMANYGQAQIHRVASPPKYDEQWRVIDSGQFFDLPDMPPIKFERLRIRHDDFAIIVALDEMAKACAETPPRTSVAELTSTDCEEKPDQAHEDHEPPSEAGQSVDHKPKRGRNRKVPENAQPEADRVACQLYERTGNELPTRDQICTTLSKSHGGAMLTWRTRFSSDNCHNAIQRYKKLKERK